MAPKRKLESGQAPAAKRVTALDMFRQKFIEENKDKYGSDFVRHGHRPMLDAWNALPSSEKEEYRSAAKRKREDEMENLGIPPKEPAARRGRTAAFLTRCSPYKFQRLVARLTPDQRADIEEMGFGGLLHVDCKFMGLDVIKKLAMDFDCFRRRAVLLGRAVQVTARDVGNVLGIPSLGMPVPILKKSLLPDDVLDLSNISIPSLEDNMMKGSVNRLFRRSFILYALTVLLCPTSRNGPTPRHLGSVVDVRNPAQYNWAQFVLDWLVDDIQSFKGDGQPKKSIGGCIYFLMIFYFDKCPIYATVQVGKEPPLTKQWKNNLIQLRIQAERRTKDVPVSKGVQEAHRGRQGIAGRLRHKLSITLSKQLAEHDLSLKAVRMTLEDIDKVLIQKNVPSNPLSSSHLSKKEWTVEPEPLETQEGREEEEEEEQGGREDEEEEEEEDAMGEGQGKTQGEGEGEGEGEGDGDGEGEVEGEGEGEEAEEGKEAEEEREGEAAEAKDKTEIGGELIKDGEEAEGEKGGEEENQEEERETDREKVGEEENKEEEEEAAGEKGGEERKKDNVEEDQGEKGGEEERKEEVEEGEVDRGGKEEKKEVLQDEGEKGEKEEKNVVGRQGDKGETGEGRAEEVETEDVGACSLEGREEVVVSAVVQVPTVSSQTSVQRDVRNKAQLENEKVKVEARIKLLEFCFRKPKTQNASKTLVSIYNATLTRSDIRCLLPNEWISNMVVMFAAELWNNQSPHEDGVVERHHICPTFMDKIITFWQKTNEEELFQSVFEYFTGSYNVFESHWVVIPTVFANHWTCYFLDPAEGVLYVLDSLYNSEETPRKELDVFTASCLDSLMEEFFHGREDPLRIVYAEVPQQNNSDDCGVYMLKFMENWNNEQLEGYTEEFIKNARNEYALNWVTHPKNRLRETVLKAAKVWSKLG